jgi:hypothetical protein
MTDIQMRDFFDGNVVTSAETGVVVFSINYKVNILIFRF